MQNKFKLTVLVVAIVLTQASPFAGYAYDQSTAASYLKNGSIEDWTVMGLAAAGSLSGVDINFLSDNPGASALDIEKRILSRAAAGQNATALADTLAGNFNGAEITTPGSSVLNDDIFGLLAFAVANHRSDIRFQLVSFIKQNQNSDGGWSYAHSPSSSDSNMTAVAVMALVSGGEPANSDAITRAFAYLETTKAPAGFRFDAINGYPPDGATTAWVVSAYYAAGRTPPASAVTFLNDLQRADGSFAWQESDTVGDQYVSSQAVIALANKFFPVRPAGSGHNNQTSQNHVTILGPNGTIFQGTVNDSATALESLVNSAAVGGFTYVTKNTAFGVFVESVAGIEPSGQSGWLYAVNGVKPTVGAANFSLNSGDRVLWFYGGPNDPVPNAGSNDNDFAFINLTVNIENPVPPGGTAGTSTAPVIIFDIDTTELDFGTMRAGEDSATHPVGLINKGNVDLAIHAELEAADIVYEQGLHLGGMLWSSYQENINHGHTENVDLSLRVPASYGQFGQKTARLVFWAEPK